MQILVVKVVSYLVNLLELLPRTSSSSAPGQLDLLLLMHRCHLHHLPITAPENEGDVRGEAGGERGAVLAAGHLFEVGARGRGLVVVEAEQAQEREKGLGVGKVERAGKAAGVALAKNKNDCLSELTEFKHTRLPPPSADARPLTDPCLGAASKVQN